MGTWLIDGQWDFQWEAFGEGAPGQLVIFLGELSEEFSLLFLLYAAMHKCDIQPREEANTQQETEQLESQGNGVNATGWSITAAHLTVHFSMCEAVRFFTVYTWRDWVFCDLMPLQPKWHGTKDKMLCVSYSHRAPSSFFNHRHLYHLSLVISKI